MRRWGGGGGRRERERERRERERERERDRETERQRETETDRAEPDRQTNRYRDTETDTERETHTVERQTHTQRDRESAELCNTDPRCVCGGGGGGREGGSDLGKGRRVPVPNIPGDEWENRWNDPCSQGLQNALVTTCDSKNSRKDIVMNMPLIQIIHYLGPQAQTWTRGASSLFSAIPAV